ncbi:gamma-glutamyltransferase [Chromatiales bacterium (ex Bugula neritina AB1)]|nr:gamma-glutamyltransferase [Chromatiales bacterium (ex Bugula neritina AB1)]
MTKGIISAPQPEAVEAGADILADGGNAIDAAIAAALVQTAVDPQMCGIAGFGSMHLYMPETASHQLIDFHGRAPLAATPDMWEDLVVRETEDGFGFILSGRQNECGYTAATTPMTLHAFDQALKRFGTRSLGDLLEPAIEYAEEGFLVRPHVYAFWNLPPIAGRMAYVDLMTKFPATRKIYCNENGELHKVGHKLVNKDLARTYRQLQKHGSDDFYHGELSQQIVADMERHGGLISSQDLASVSCTDSTPLRGEYRGYDVATNRPPGGGIMLVEMLNILEHFDLQGMGHNSANYIATVSEAMKIATVDKDNHVGDPLFMEIPIDRLCAKDSAASYANRIKQGEKTSVPRWNAGGEESRNTTHISVSDSHGNCVSLTHSLGMPSGVVTDGLGFMYNGCMAVFDPRPGRPGSIAPGKSRFSAMCPTMIFQDGAPVLVVGAPGGTYITMGVLQVILNVLEFGMTAQEAVSAPRFCTTSDVIDITNRILRKTERALESKGYQVRRSPHSYHFAGVQAIRKNGDEWDGGSDPGRDGMVISV